MASTIELFGAICFILVRLFLLNGVQGEFLKSFNNATEHESSHTSGRLKRSLADHMPKKLYIQIEYETLKTENLVFLKTDQNVANSHLPVDAPSNYLFRDKVMNDIGEFVMYQDLTRSSAIVYFEKLKAIFGVYRTDYYIEGYPLQWYHNGLTIGTVRSPYVTKRENILFQMVPNVFSANHMNKDQGTYEMGQNNEQIMNPQAGPSTRPDSIQENSDKTDIEWKKNTRPSTYHLETLVFISKGITEIYYQVFKDDFINEIVRYYLVYFNAVDVLFQKLNIPNVYLNINIAKIVFEDETLRPFDFINQGEIHFTELIFKLPTYLKKYSCSYPPDSFDHVFIVTDRFIMFDNTPTRALTKGGDDLISARANGKFYEAVPITAIKAETYGFGYHQVAANIAKILSPDIDLLENKERLEWSQNSLHQFRAFFRENPNRVFLRNKPRSLLSPGPRVLITPEAQCKCLGYDYYKKGPIISTVRISQNECTKPLQCNKEGTEQLYSAPLWPLDGTSCSKNKVCWAGQCVLRTE